MTTEYKLSIFCSDKKAVARIRNYLLNKYKVYNIRILTKDNRITLKTTDNYTDILIDLKDAFPKGFLQGQGDIVK